MFRRDFVHEKAIHHTLTVAYKQGCTKLKKTVYKLAKGNQANIVENLYDVPEEALLLEIGAAVVRLEGSGASSQGKKGTYILRANSRGSFSYFVS